MSQFENENKALFICGNERKFTWNNNLTFYHKFILIKTKLCLNYVFLSDDFSLLG